MSNNFSNNPDANKAVQAKIAKKRQERLEAKKDLDLDTAVAVANLDTVDSTERQESTKTSKAKMSSDELAELRRQKKQERIRMMKDREVLAIDESLKKPGKRYRLTNLNPTNIAFQRSRGYEICQEPIHKGDGSLNNASMPAGCVEVATNKSHKDDRAVWMETDEENGQILDEIEADLAAEQDNKLARNEVVDENGQSLLKSKLTKG